MLKGSLHYLIKGIWDINKSQYEINEKMKCINKYLSDKKEALLHSHQEIDKHKKYFDELSSALDLSQKNRFSNSEWNHNDKRGWTDYHW